MNIKKNKCKKICILNRLIPFTIIIILLFLIILSFLPKPIFVSQRKLQTTEPSQGINVTENITNSEPEEDFGAELTAGFLFFCFIAIYILVRLDKFPDDIKNRKKDLYTFMYFANNGTLIASGVNIINVFDPNSDILHEILNYGPLFLTSLIYVIGGICFIVYLVKSNCDPNIFFSCDTLCSIAKLPCFVWDLIPLADYCCMCTTVTTYYYADGHTESDACCVCLWNLFIKFLKFISYVYSVISFYIFYIIFIIGWLIAKLIYQIVLCCRKNEDQNEEQVVIPPVVDPVNPPEGPISTTYPPIVHYREPTGVINININNNVNNVNFNRNSPNENINHNLENLNINQNTKNQNYQNLNTNKNSQPLNINQISPNGNFDENHQKSINENIQNKINNQNNLNAIINQNQTLNTNLSQNDVVNTPVNQQNENLDYPSEEQEDIKQEPNSNTDREMNPAPIRGDDAFQNPINDNESQDKSYKQSEKDEDMDFQFVPNLENNF